MGKKKPQTAKQAEKKRNVARDAKGRLTKGHANLNDGGRPLGSPNKVPSRLVERVLKALDDLDKLAQAKTKQDYLVVQGLKNPKEFLALLGKLIPKNIEMQGALGIGTFAEFVKFVSSRSKDESGTV